MRKTVRFHYKCLNQQKKELESVMDKLYFQLNAMGYGLMYDDRYSENSGINS